VRRTRFGCLLIANAAEISELRKSLNELQSQSLLNPNDINANSRRPINNNSGFRYLAPDVVDSEQNVDADADDESDVDVDKVITTTRKRRRKTSPKTTSLPMVESPTTTSLSTTTAATSDESVLPVLVFCYNRAAYLNQTLTTLFK
jgi:hypothetical protein